MAACRVGFERNEVQLAQVLGREGRPRRRRRIPAASHLVTSRAADEHPGRARTTPRCCGASSSRRTWCAWCSAVARASSRTGVPDEWVGLVVPGQFQSRYYTVRSLDGDELDPRRRRPRRGPGHRVGRARRRRRAGRRHRGQGLLRRCPTDAAWLMLVGDLTAMPAMARIAADAPSLPSADLGRGARRPAAATCPTRPGDHLARDRPRDGRLGPGRGRRADRLARRRRLLLDGGGVGADARDPQAPDARAAAAQHGVRRDGLLARRCHAAARAPSTPARSTAPARPPGKTDEQIWADYDEARHD